jgi:hypothetical protein
LSPSSPGFGRRGLRGREGRPAGAGGWGTGPVEPEGTEGEAGGQPAVRIGAVLDGLLAARPWRSGVALGELARRWPEVVGERLAAESSPAAMGDGVLVIAVSSAAWAAQVRFLAEEIRNRAEPVVGGGEIGAIRVVVRSG